MKYFIENASTLLIMHKLYYKNHIFKMSIKKMVWVPKKSNSTENNEPKALELILDCKEF